MARPLAADHHAKRAAILAQAAELFARHGYDRASLTMIGAASGVSKALVYHYWRDKEELLFEVLDLHLRKLVETARAAPPPGSAPRARLEALAVRLLEAYRDADAVHRVQLACLSLLSPPRQLHLKAMERELVAIAAGLIQALHPQTPAHLLKPLAMSFYAMLNWHYLWHREGGRVSRAEYARIAAALIAGGTPEAAAALGAEAAGVPARPPRQVAS